jgi:hypothetical protein
MISLPLVESTLLDLIFSKVRSSYMRTQPAIVATHQVFDQIYSVMWTYHVLSVSE